MCKFSEFEQGMVVGSRWADVIWDSPALLLVVCAYCQPVQVPVLDWQEWNPLCSSAIVAHLPQGFIRCVLR